MITNLTDFEIQNQPAMSPTINIQDSSNLISSISLAICSILLSVSGCIVALSKSRCSTIKCGKVEIEREPIEDV